MLFAVGQHYDENGKEQYSFVDEWMLVNNVFYCFVWADQQDSQWYLFANFDDDEDGEEKPAYFKNIRVSEEYIDRTFATERRRKLTANYNYTKFVNRLESLADVSSGENYREIYADEINRIAAWSEENDIEVAFDFIYIDNDEIPEIIIDYSNGSWYLKTCHDGQMSGILYNDFEKRYDITIGGYRDIQNIRPYYVENSNRIVVEERIPRDGKDDYVWDILWMMTYDGSDYAQKNSAYIDDGVWYLEDNRNRKISSERIDNIFLSDYLTEAKGVYTAEEALAWLDEH